MLSSIAKPSSFFLIVLLLFSLALLTQSGEIVKVKKICSKAPDPIFCSKILNSIPGGAKDKDLVTLGQYVINVAQANLSSTVALLKSLINNATDPKLKQQYQKCNSTYSNDVAGILEGAKSDLKNGYYSNIRDSLSVLGQLVNICFDSLPVDEESPLVRSSGYLVSFGDIIRTIGKLLDP